MTDKSYPNIKTFIIIALSKRNIFKLKACRKEFILHAFSCFSGIKGKKNFLQTEHFSDRCEQYFSINYDLIVA